MIQWIRFALTAAFVLSGIAVCCIGVLGVYRLQYAANRMHAAALNDTLGIGLCMIGWAISAPDVFTAVKILLVVVFFFISGPASSHLLCRLEIETNEQREDYMTVRDLDAEAALRAQAYAAPGSDENNAENMDENTAPDENAALRAPGAGDEEVSAP